MDTLVSELETHRFHPKPEDEDYPNGEQVFKLLMETLQSLERKAGQEHYKGYPHSIAEARQYFLTK